MSEWVVYEWILRVTLVIAALVAPTLLFIAAPYGRHGETYKGLTLPAKVGWLVMEAPSSLVPAACFLLAPPRTLAPWVLLLAWQIHYVHRAFVYPFRLKPGSKRMPWYVAVSAFVFTSVNGYLNGRWLTVFGSYPNGTAFQPHFAAGLVLFGLGYFINQQSDAILLGLRAPGETGYKIPTGGLYGLVSCPNYFGEIVEWTGFALAAQSWAGWAFVVWTCANLIPRAIAHHRWYLGKFPDYPKARKAVLPFLV